MRARRTSWFSGLLALAALALPGASPAQSGIALTSLEIDLWPEYDRPGVLVIYRATLSPGVDLPAVLTFRIPAAAGEPNAVAERGANGQLTSLAHARDVDGEWARIAFTASFPVFQIEYYDPGIERDGAIRHFTFSWPGDYEVGGVSVSVQQPDQARNLTLQPAATRTAPGGDGLTYHTLSLPGAPAGQTLEVSLSYEKSADTLTVETMAAPPQSAPLLPEQSAAPDSSISTIAIVAGVAVALAGIIALFVVSGRKGAESAADASSAVGATPGSTPPRGGAAGGRAAGAAGAGGMPDGAAATAFCTQCGAPTTAGDRFCHACGAPLT